LNNFLYYGSTEAGITKLYVEQVARNSLKVYRHIKIILLSVNCLKTYIIASCRASAIKINLQGFTLAGRIAFEHIKALLRLEQSIAPSIMGLRQIYWE